MTDSEMSIRATMVATFINDLFVDGVESMAIHTLRTGFKSDSSADIAHGLVENIISYFESSNNPVNEFLFFIGVEDNDVNTDEQSIKTLRYMDLNNTPFLTDAPLAGDGLSILNSALALHFLGLKNNADNLLRIGVKILMEGVFSDEISIREFNNIAQKAISENQRERAKKPRSPFYSEVIEVIKLTWEKYPGASKTALLDNLAAHYHKKVSRNALDNWIALSGLRPKKPEKYTSFELVFPQ